MLVRPSLSTKKEFTVTQSPFTVTTLGTPDTIPTSESTLYGKTLEASDFPTFSFPPYSVKYIGRIGVHGYNTSGSSINVSWKSYIHGSLVGTGSPTAVANANYFTVDCCIFDVYPGDNIQCAVWASANTNVTIDNYTIHVAPTRIIPTAKNAIDVSETHTIESNASISGVPQFSRTNINIFDSGITSSQFTNTFNARSFFSSNDYGMGRYGRGDYGSQDGGGLNLSPSISSPRISVSQIPTLVTYREVIP